MHERTHTTEPSKKIKTYEFHEPESTQVKEENLSEESGSPYQCRFCLKQFTRKWNCKTHEKLHTEQTQQFICSICNDDFLAESILTHHELQCTGVKETGPFKCTFCSKLFSKKWNRKVHEKLHLDEAGEIKTYEFQEQEFDNSESANETLNSQIKEEIEDFTSEVIKEEVLDDTIPDSDNSVNNMGLEDSANFTPSEELGYICTLCGQHYETSESLTIHVKTHVNNPNFFKKELGEISHGAMFKMETERDESLEQFNADDEPEIKSEIKEEQDPEEHYPDQNSLEPHLNSEQFGNHFLCG